MVTAQSVIYAKYKIKQSQYWDGRSFVVADDVISRLCHPFQACFVRTRSTCTQYYHDEIHHRSLKAKVTGTVHRWSQRSWIFHPYSRRIPTSEKYVTPRQWLVTPWHKCRTHALTAGRRVARLYRRPMRGFLWLESMTRFGRSVVIRIFLSF